MLQFPRLYWPGLPQSADTDLVQLGSELTLLEAPLKRWSCNPAAYHIAAIIHHSHESLMLLQ